MNNNMVKIPAGSFLMGQVKIERVRNAEPMHTVMLPEFLLDAKEVCVKSAKMILLVSCTLMSIFVLEANAQNKPVVIMGQPVPDTIIQAYYQDRNADGMVETVVMKFNQKVSTDNCIISFDWGGANRVDSVNATRLAYQGTDSFALEININGLFTALTSPKTSGAMQAAVTFRNMSGLYNVAYVADSAAPVLTVAQYFPGSDLNKTVRAQIDTLSLEFSEPIGTLMPHVSFQAFSEKTQTNYLIDVNTGITASTDTRFRFLVDSIVGTNLPVSGDSIWIDPASTISDNLGSVQLNPNNRKVVLKVYPSQVIIPNPDTATTKAKSKSGCGSGIGLALFPPIWFKIRSWKKRMEPDSFAKLTQKERG